MTAAPPLPPTVEACARKIGSLAARLGATGWLARLDQAVADAVRQARAAAAERIEVMRRQGSAPQLAEGRAVEGIVVAALLFLFGPLVADLPAAALCATQTVRIPFGLAPAACAAETADGLGLLWLIGSLLAWVPFYFVGRWALAVTNDIAHSEARMVEDPERQRVLVMGLSEASPPPDEQIREAAAHAGSWQDFAGPARPGDRRGGNWQQGARVIRHHLATLEAIYLLPSSRSLDQVEAFRTYCRTLFGRDIPIRRINGPDGEPFGLTGLSGPLRDYESYDYVYEGLKRGVTLAREAIPDLAEKDVCIDVTAGQKIFSVAAGVLTLNRGLRFCYTTTGATSGRIIVYDAQLRGFGSLAEAARSGG